jgi:hypothetical protein
VEALKRRFVAQRKEHEHNHAILNTGVLNEIETIVFVALKLQNGLVHAQVSGSWALSKEFAEGLISILKCLKAKSYVLSLPAGGSWLSYRDPLHSERG